MIALMTNENATQGGYSGAAVLADVTATMRRLVGILLQPGDFAQIQAKCFEGKKGFETARGKLLAKLKDPDKDGGLGWPVIMRYLGHGDAAGRYPARPEQHLGPAWGQGEGLEQLAASWWRESTTRLALNAACHVGGFFLRDHRLDIRTPE
jgi:hypothetical protein